MDGFDQLFLTGTSQQTILLIQVASASNSNKATQVQAVLSFQGHLGTRGQPTVQLQYAAICPADELVRPRWEVSEKTSRPSGRPFRMSSAEEQGCKHLSPELRKTDGCALPVSLGSLGVDCWPCCLFGSKFSALSGPKYNPNY